MNIYEDILFWCFKMVFEDVLYKVKEIVYEFILMKYCMFIVSKFVEGDCKYLDVINKFIGVVGKFIFIF